MKLVRAYACEIFPLLFSEEASIETPSSVRGVSRVLFIIFRLCVRTLRQALQLLPSFLALLDFNLLFVAT